MTYEYYGHLYPRGVFTYIDDIVIWGDDISKAVRIATLGYNSTTQETLSPRCSSGPRQPSAA